VRVLLVTEIPSPFRVPLFNALAERVELRVLFLAERDPRRPHYRVHADEMRFDYRVLAGWELARGGRWLVLTRGTRSEIRRFAPDVVVAGGWNQPAYWAARRAAPKLAVWVESTLADERPGTGVLERVKRRFARGADLVIVPGRASRAYAQALGVEDRRIRTAPNAVDTSVFAGAAVDRSGRPEPTFLYVGRLDAEKGLDVLLEAFREVPGRLVLAGSGAEGDRLRGLADERVQFAGPVDRDDLPALYARADVFVLPSRSEPWGMVLNEAATAGLPLVSTDAAGAAHELIEEGVNGYVVPVDDVLALRAALDRLARSEDLRLRLGAHSLEVAGRFTPELWADAVVQALKPAPVPSAG